MAGGEDITGAATPGGPDCPTGNARLYFTLHHYNHSDALPLPFCLSLYPSLCPTLCLIFPSTDEVQCHRACRQHGLRAGGSAATCSTTAPRGPDCPTGTCNTAHSTVHHHREATQSLSLICRVCVCVCVQEKDVESVALTEEVEILRKNEITLNLNIAECADVSSIVYMYTCIRDTAVRYYTCTLASISHC